MTTRISAPQPLLTDPVDVLLADVAIRVQLSRTDYSRAVDRYETINEWIERDNSPLKDRVQLFYAQGSMAIGATIASKLRTDEFDIDVVAQLSLPPDVAPKEALDLLFEAIRGEPGSRYYCLAKRRTRCVTVDYADDMHLDVTPVVRMGGTPERQSILFHHRAEAPQDPSCRLIANPSVLPSGSSRTRRTTTPSPTSSKSGHGSTRKRYEFLRRGLRPNRCRLRNRRSGSPKRSSCCSF